GNDPRQTRGRTACRNGIPLLCQRLCWRSGVVGEERYGLPAGNVRAVDQSVHTAGIESRFWRLSYSVYQVKVSYTFTVAAATPSCVKLATARSRPLRLNSS